MRDSFLRKYHDVSMARSYTITRSTKMAVLRILTVQPPQYINASVLPAIPFHTIHKVDHSTPFHAPPL
jgi:hypothetical protein